MEQLDTELFRWINTHHAPLLDWVMWVASQAWSWAVVILLVYGLLLWRAKGQNGSASRHLWWMVLLGIGLCFLLSDRVSVLCFKDVFQRLRPCHALDDVRMFRTQCGGQYGFVSSHAANAFAVALFLGLWWRRACLRVPRRNGMLWLLLAWAVLVAYSRPYLGKHYPGDIVCGAALGLLLGWISYLIISWMARRAEAKSSQ